MSAKFYICEHCGNLVGMIHDSGVPMMCCGQKMTALLPNTVEASGEKHLPAVTVEDGAVHVNLGSINHPMIPEHYIEWIYVQTENSGHLKIRKPFGDACHHVDVLCGGKLCRADEVSLVFTVGVVYYEDALACP